MNNFLDILKEKIMVFDGAMGTSIQKYNLNPDDFKGHDGCNEWLLFSKPEVIGEIHANFFKAGADVIETNSFGGIGLVLQEYNLSDKSYEINYKAAKLAKSIARDFSTLDKPRFASGSMGPGTKLPSLGQIDFTSLRNYYIEQVEGLIDGGVDMLQIETTQDMLQIKVALSAVYRVFKEKKIKLPVIVQVTMQENGRMLLGSDMMTIIGTFGSMQIVDVLGLNCGTGPQNMKEYVRTLSHFSPKYISVLPNAGLPVVVDGKLSYDLTAQEFAKQVSGFSKDFGVNIVGGCCGTTYDFIEALSEEISQQKIVMRDFGFTNSLTSLYNPQAINVNPKPLLVGEKTNTNGSKKFRKLLKAENWNLMLESAIEQQNSGAHLVDICLATIDRNESADMNIFSHLLNKSLQIPIMIDSTSPEVVEKALMNCAGNPIINSTNFEDGDQNVIKYLELCQEYGAFLICLAIDEEGMAKDSKKKIEILTRFVNLSEKIGVSKDKLFFDFLTFTLGTGEENYRDAAIESLISIKSAKKLYPQVASIMGVSNISFGLKKKTRQMLNTVFLNECVKNGLDAAIIDATKIIPLSQIPDDATKLCMDLIYDKKKENYDPLLILAEKYSKVTFVETEISENLCDEKKLINNVIKGSVKELEIILENLLERFNPLSIINDFLLKAMQEVGNLFDSGKMQLPFVLKSVEVMKKSVNYLEQFIEKKDESKKIKVLLATVQGDVHDIGKNLVEIILSNNGCEIIDLGVKQTAQQILQGIKTYQPDCLGLSALLIKSTMKMKDNLIFLKENNIDIPVLCGGAALSEKFVNEELQPVYGGKVIYGKDAFAGLKAVNNLMSSTYEKGKETVPLKGNKESKKHYKKMNFPMDNPIPIPPFYGKSEICTVNFEELSQWLNKRFLFYSQWQLKANELASDKKMRKFAEMNLEKMKKWGKEYFEPKFLYGYFSSRSDKETVSLFIKNPKISYACGTLDCEIEPEKESIVFNFPHSSNKPFLSIADFIRKKEAPRNDLSALQIVTIGNKAVDFAHQLKKKDKFQDYFLWYGFCSAMTEALADYAHSKIRKEMGISHKESGKPEDSFKKKYQGARYSFGYNCCPDIFEQKKALELLDAKRIGIEMTDGGLLNPEFSTCAFILHHPSAILW